MVYLSTYLWDLSFISAISVVFTIKFLHVFCHMYPQEFTYHAFSSDATFLNILVSKCHYLYSDLISWDYAEITFQFSI